LNGLQKRMIFMIGKHHERSGMYSGKPHYQGTKASEFIFMTGQLGSDPKIGGFALTLEVWGETALSNLKAVVEAEGRRFIHHCENDCLCEGFEFRAAFQQIIYPVLPRKPDFPQVCRSFKARKGCDKCHRCRCCREKLIKTCEVARCLKKLEI